MSLQVVVDYLPAKERLDALFALTGDLLPAMSAIGMEMENRVRGRFETETDPLGLPWAEWAESTVANYPKDGHNKLLDRFGDMYEGTSNTADSNSVTIGFDRDYAAYHEFITEHMERRGLLFADPESGTIAPDDELAIINIVDLVFSQAAR